MEAFPALLDGTPCHSGGTGESKERGHEGKERGLEGPRTGGLESRYRGMEGRRTNDEAARANDEDSRAGGLGADNEDSRGAYLFCLAWRALMRPPNSRPTLTTRGEIRS